MSYLAYPRLTFAGRFQTEPSTVNNNPVHYRTSTFTSNLQKTGPAPYDGEWNPDGSASWRMHECVITSVAYSATEIYTTTAEDPMVGMALTGADDRVSAKLVDPDPQRMASEIWGLKINLGSPTYPQFLQSDFAVAPFADFWVRYPEGFRESYNSAYYQSVLDALQWSDEGQQLKFFKQLQALNKKLKQDFSQLSIRFTVDGYDDTPTSPNFTYGRVVGAIGPYMDGEPQKFVAGRLLRPVPIPPPMDGPPPKEGPLPSPMNFAPCQIIEDTKQKTKELVVDLSNSLPTSTAAGPMYNLGDLQIAVWADTKYILLGSLDYQRADWYQTTGGIQSFSLIKDKEDLSELASSSFLAIVKVEDGKVVDTYLQENADGAYARTDDFVLRMDAHTRQYATLYATKFGKPVPNQTFSLGFGDLMMAKEKPPTRNDHPPTNIPHDALTFPASVQTGKDGTATIEFTGGDPKNPRVYIDGQIYGIYYTWDGIDKTDYKRNPSNYVTVLLWDAYDYDEPATWIDNVQPIFQQYANLYPVMRPIVDLSDYQSVMSRLDPLKMVFNLPQSHPNYMPVTRDLSGAKLGMIQSWLEQPLYMAIRNVEDLRQALQVAIELEHATIPTYLAGYLSIIPGKNQEAADIIRSVVIEEMLHMALACNLLNAVGGSPSIASTDFVPNYPGPMPAGLHPGLTVSLKKCSLDQIQDVFMTIEQPGESGDPVVHNPMTIGWFYNLIKEAMERLSQQGNIFTGDPSRQITDWPGVAPGNLLAVTDLASAQAAINEIVEQGEGASPVNPEDGYDELAHYYKFSEIVHGRRIELTADGFSYTGAEIPFDPDGVYPMVDNPNVDDLPEGSLAKRRSLQFNQTYANFLKAMHKMANGQPESMKEVVGMMFNLSVQGHKLMQTPISSVGIETAGPSFQLPKPRLFYIQTELNGDMLTIYDGLVAPDTYIVNSPQGAPMTDYQLWELVPTDDPCYVYIQSKMNGYVVGIRGKVETDGTDERKQEGALIVSQPRLTPASDAQLWELTPDEDDPNFVFIHSKLNGNVLDIKEANKKAGVPVQSWILNKTPAQRWALIAAA
ncbi:MAG: ferritin-like domain-containing protein [Chloroflexota bacterium]